MEIQGMWPLSPVRAWWDPMKRGIIEQYVLKGDAEFGWPIDWVMAREMIPVWQVMDNNALSSR